MADFPAIFDDTEDHPLETKNSPLARRHSAPKLRIYRAPRYDVGPISRLKLNKVKPN